MIQIDLHEFTELLNIKKVPFEIENIDLGESYVFRLGVILGDDKKVKWVDKIVISRNPYRSLYKLHHSIRGFYPHELPASFLAGFSYLLYYPLKHHHQYPYIHQLYNSQRSVKTLLVHHGIHNSKT